MGNGEGKGSTMMKDLTQGNILRQFLLFSFPLFVSNALQAAYNIVDMVIVGQVIGGSGMSAVSIGGDILHLATFVAMGFSSAGQVLVARLVGASKHREVSETIGTMFTSLLGFSLVMSVLCLVLRNPILHVLNTPSESYAYALDYLTVCMFGLVFIYGYNIVSAILRGMGDSRRPFMFVAIAAILNTVLDYVFIAILDMKVFGAALATVIGQGVSFIFSLFYLIRRREGFGFDFRLKSFRITRTALKPLVSLGVPMAIQSAAISFSKIVLLSWINLEGVVYSALAGMYNKINMVIGVVGNSFTYAGSTMVGQNLGAKKYDRVPKILLVNLACGFVVSILCCTVLILFPTAIYGLFTKESNIIAIAGILTVPVILNFIGNATRNASFALINGSGNSKLNFFVAILDGLFLRIGLAAVLCFGFGMGSLGCWYGDVISGFMPFAIGLTFFLSRKWRR